MAPRGREFVLGVGFHNPDLARLYEMTATKLREGVVYVTHEEEADAIRQAQKWRSA